jgi:hypothetical protein
LAVQLKECYEQDCNFLSSIVLTAQQDVSASAQKINEIKKQQQLDTVQMIEEHNQITK